MDGQSKENSPKIIAQFNIVESHSPREQFLEEYHHCPLCGTELIYAHVTNFIQEMVKEEAFCSACNIRTKANEHKLH
jgi:transcription elongation factor Elf1